MENNVESDKKPATSLNELEPVLNKIAQYRTPIPAAFILVVIFFFFGFCSFRCNGTKVASLKGINLVTGTHLKTQVGEVLNNNPFSSLMRGNENLSTTKGQKVPASFWAILAFASAIGGFIAFYRKEKKEALIGTVLGITGIISLFILQLVIKSKLENQTGGMIHIETSFLFGYWASLLAFIVAGGISYLRFKKEQTAKSLPADNASPPPASTPIQVNIITQDDPDNQQ